MSIDTFHKKNETIEAAKQAHVFVYDRAQIKNWEKEGTEYPHKDMVQILLAERFPALQAQSMMEKIKGSKKWRVATIDGVARKVVPVGMVYEGEYGSIGQGNIEATEMLPDILVGKGFGPCPFMAGFKDGKAFLIHNSQGPTSRLDFAELLRLYGIKMHDRDLDLVVGGGTKNGGVTSGQSGTRRRALIRAAESCGLAVRDIAAQSDPSMPGWDTTSVAIDPTTSTIVVIMSSEYQDDSFAVNTAAN